MQWVELTPWFLYGLGMTLLPGYFLAKLTGSNWVQSLPLAPLFSFGLLGIAATVSGSLGWTWGTRSYLLVSAAVLLFCLLMRGLLRLTGRFSSEPQRENVTNLWAPLLAPLLALLLAAFLLIRQLLTIIGYPEAFSQSYDNIFHLNAVRWIFDTGDASSLHLGSMTSADGSPAFYPASWHGFVALFFSFFGGTPTVSTNVATLLVAAVFWPLSIWALAAAIKPRNPLFVASAVVLSAVLLSYPGLMLKWGILYPNLLGYALLPGFLALMVGFLGQLEKFSLRGMLVSLPQIMLGGLSIALAHPNTVTAAAVLLLPLILGYMVKVARGQPAQKIAQLFLGAAGLLVCGLIWWKVRPNIEGGIWPPTLTNGHALGEVLANSYNGNSAQWGIFGFLLLALVLAFKKRELLSLVASFALVAFLYIVVSSWEMDDPLRIFLTGPWYNDKVRLAALSAIPLLILLAYGLSWLATWLLGFVQQKFSLKQGLVSGLSLGLVLLAGLGLSGSVALDKAGQSAHREFTILSDSLLITADELKVLDVLPRYVQKGEEVLVNPWDGSALAYAFDDVQVTLRHSQAEYSEDYDALYLELSNYRANPEVCQEVETSQVRWYLDFEDTLNIGEGWKDRYIGLERALESGALEPVYTSGQVGLYRLVACGE